MASQECVIQLGRYGDILNLLPALQEMDREGRRPKLVLAEDFHGLLGGVSYVDPVRFKGKVGEIREAVRRARVKYPKAKTAQTWGDDWKCPRTKENFQREQWARIGMDARFEQLSLVIDRRSAEREAALVETALAGFTDKSLPLLLISLKAVSSPIRCQEMLAAMLESELAGRFNILDISMLPVTKLYDLLGLMDIAFCLVTVDTATLHLANASSVPVVALVSSDSWNASLRRPNHIYRSAYNDIDPVELVAAILRTADIPRPGQKIVHVYSVYPAPNSAEVERISRAQESWHMEAMRSAGDVRWSLRPVNEGESVTSEEEIGDTRRLPFVKDLIELGFMDTQRLDDIIVLTNADVGFTRGMTKRLRQILSLKGAAFAYRFDFDGPVNSEDMTPLKVASGRFLGGLDVVAFTREFWLTHRHRFPDAILGCSNWDLHFRDIIKQLRGGELYGCHWHEVHPSPWQKLGSGNPGNSHNGKLYAKFLKDHDRTRPYTL